MANEYTTITVDMTRIDSTAPNGTLYAEMHHVVTLANNDVVYPEKRAFTVTNGVASISLACTTTAIKNQNAAYTISFAPTGQPEKPLGRIIPTASASPLNLSDLLEVGATALIVNRTVVGASNIAIFESLAALRATSNRANRDLAFVSDTGWFRCVGNTGEAESGALIVSDADGKEWYLEEPSIRAYPLIYNIALYGAVGDDATDCTTYIQNAINAASAAGAGVVHVPEGIFRFSRLTLKGNVILAGVGMNASILKCTDAATVDGAMAFGSALRRADDGTSVAYVGLRDLAVVTATSSVAAAQASFPNVIGLNLAGCAYSHVQNVYLAGFGYAGLVLAQANAGAEGLGFASTVQDGNYNTIINLQATANGAHCTATAQSHVIAGDTNSNTTVSGISAADMARVRIGDAISGAGIPAGATVTAIASSTSIVISAAATATASAVSLTLKSKVAPNVWLKYKANSNKFFGLYSSGGAPSVEFSGATTSTSKTISSVSASVIAQLTVGMYVTGEGIPNLAQIESIGATYFVISAAATATDAAVDIIATGYTNGLVIEYGNDNVFHGGCWESIARGVWFGTEASENLVTGFRVEGVRDSAVKVAPTASSAFPNMVLSLHESNVGVYRDVAAGAYIRMIAGPFTDLVSGPLQTDNLAVTTDHHFLRVLGILTDPTTGITYIKSPGVNTTPDLPPKFRLLNTNQAPGAGDTLAELQAYCSDTTASAEGANAIIRFKAFDGAGRCGFSFLTGTNDAPTEALEVDIDVKATKGNLVASLAGKGLQIKEGSNARMGTATLVGGTILVNNTSVTANTRIFYCRSTTGGTPGHLSYTISAGASFTINSSEASDTSTINWMLVEPAS